MKAYGGSGYTDTSFLDLGTQFEVSGQLHAPAALLPVKGPLVPIG
jgi:hypothetical protein